MVIIAALFFNISLYFAPGPVVIEKLMLDKYLTRRRWAEIVTNGYED